MSILRNHGTLVAVVILAGVLRLTGLAENPVGLFRDEADKGYTTYSLLKTGRDLDGRFWPLQVKAMKAFTSPLYHWLSLPFVAVWGLGVFTVRLTAALGGSLACGAVYLLGKRWGGKTLGVLSGVLLALSPWHFLFSRWANQGILLTLFVPLAVWATWNLAHPAPDKTDRPLLWGWMAAVCWALAWVAYAPARLFVPLFLCCLLGIEVLRGGRGPAARRIFGAGLGTLVLISPFVVDILLHWESTQTRLRFLVGSNPIDPAALLAGYLKHWDPRYLFWVGDGNPRHHFYVFAQGQLSLVESVGCALGLWVLFREKPPWRPWILAWLLVSPVPAAVTREGLPHALRTIMIVPGFCFLAASGWRWVHDRLRSYLGKATWSLPGGVFLFQTLLNLTFFLVDYPERSGLYWEEGTVEAIRSVESNRRPGELCTVTGLIEYPETFVLFVTQPDPRSVQGGKAPGGFRFLPTGRRFDPRRDDRRGLLLLRSWEIRKAPWWIELEPDPQNRGMQKFWRLYRSAGLPGDET